MINLNNMSVKELKDLKKFISKYDNISDIMRSINAVIEDRMSDVSFNEKFDMAMFKRLKIFTDKEIEILINNNIFNLQDLIDCDLSNLNILESFREKLDWTRKFYDMRSVEKEEMNKKKK